MEEIPFDDVIIEYRVKGKKDKYDKILEEVEFQKKMYNISLELKITLDEANIQAKKNLQSLYSTHDKFASDFFIKSFNMIIDAGFEKKIDVNYDEIQKLTTLMKKNSVAFVSSHKSYLDLIIFFIILKKYELPLPFIFSGINLNMPIVGDIVRKSGVIFIKREIKTDIIYKAVLKHFISWLLKKRIHFVWSIEGGRTRTGKLGNPKMGILKYISEENIKIVPVSIIYDSIPDLDELATEAQGKNKKMETLDWMVNYLKKICSENRGKISLRFADPIEKKDDLSKLALNIIHNINNITPITIVSLICSSLLSKISLTEKDLWYAVSDLINIINNKNLLLDKNITLRKSIEKGIRLLTLDDIIRKEENRYVLNHNKYYQAMYYTNMSIHHFYKRAFVEIATISSDFWKEINFLKELFSYEFFYTDEFEREISEIKDKLELEKENIFLSPIVFNNCIGIYTILLESWKKCEKEKTEKEFLNSCMFLSEEYYWLGKIKRSECFLPFLQNAYPIIKKLDVTKISKFLHKINRLDKKVNNIFSLSLSKKYPEEVIEEENVTPLTENILKGEKGSHIGVFFDLDKTLIQGVSAWSFSKKRVMSGKVTTSEVINQFLGLVQYIYKKENFENMAKTAAFGLFGISEKEFLDIGDESYMKDIKIYDEAYDLISAHRKMSHTICIISAASKYQVAPIAKHLNIDIVECTELETNEGKFTGEIKKLCWGEGKKEAGLELAKKYNLDLQKTYFYTDSIEDVKLLEIVGQPRPVNPDLELLNLSFSKGWDIKNFGDQENQIENVMRTGMSYLNLLPAVVKGFSEGGKYKALEALGDVATSIGGINLKVEKEEIVWENRPAVFIFNHQSHADMIVVIKLIKKDAVSIARKEIKNYPLIGPILDAAGTVFIDTENRDSAIEALKPAVDGLKKGISLVIFPEGTRSFGYNLGPFKKGAFHIAMQAGVPVVPIVIKNSHDIMPRGSYTIIPGIIDVKVLPPIQTTDWTLGNLDEKISEIRNLYLKELNQI